MLYTAVKHGPTGDQCMLHTAVKHGRSHWRSVHVVYSCQVPLEISACCIQLSNMAGPTIDQCMYIQLSNMVPLEISACCIQLSGPTIDQCMLYTVVRSHYRSVHAVYSCQTCWSHWRSVHVVYSCQVPL